MAFVTPFMMLQSDSGDSQGSDSDAESTAASSINAPLGQQGNHSKAAVKPVEVSVSKSSAQPYPSRGKGCSGTMPQESGRMYGSPGTYANIAGMKGNTTIAAKGSGKKGRKAVSQTCEVCVLEAGQTPSASFSLRGALLGRGGENFKHIREETGVRLWLAGSGAAQEDAKADQTGPLRIVLSSDNLGMLDHAVEIAKDLVATVRERREQHLQRFANEQMGSNVQGKASDRSTGKGRGSQAERTRNSTVEYRKQLNEEKSKLEKQIEHISKQTEVHKSEAKDKLRDAIEARRQLEARRTQDQNDEVTSAASDAIQCGECGSEFKRSVVSADRARQFWAELERSRQVSEEELNARRAEMAARREVGKLATETLPMQRQAYRQIKQLKAQMAMMSVATVGKKSDRCCALFVNGSCPFQQAQQCPRGSHEQPAAPTEADVFRKITKAKFKLLQQKWNEAGGNGNLVNAWQVRNPKLEFLYRGAEANFADLYDQAPDVIDAWHGSAEQNVVSIAVNGFDAARRSGQAFGAGEYFAKNPNVSICYAGSFMFLCKILLGKPNVDHTWAAGPQYYVIKQRESRMQILPMFLLQFKSSSSSFYQKLTAELALTKDAEESSALVGKQKGGMFACEARRDAGMSAENTRHLWVGWLSPSLRFQDNDGVHDDICEFLHGLLVAQVVPERNGTRIGAFVLLESPVDRATFREIAKRKYRGQYTISVDDAQPANPRCTGKMCPRLAGPSKFCRGWNIRGHAAWQWGCAYEHPEDMRPTFAADVSMETVNSGSAKYDEISTELRRSIPGARIQKVQRAVNPVLETMYEQRRAFIHEKQGFAVEKELWHGTSVDAIPTLLKHGLQPPADSCASKACPVSGGKGLCTTLCGTDCKHCMEAHSWHKCHMYGLGVYLADIAQKSHQYVKKSGNTYSMLRCRVVLGNPYMIEGNLLKGDAMHDVCWCQDPSDFVETVAEDWSVANGHDAYYVRGQSGKQKHGLGVFNNEYIVFQPYQILPLYRVDYTV